MVACTGLFWLRIGTGGGRYECGDEPSSSIKCGEFLEYLKASLASQEGICSMELER